MIIRKEDCYKKKINILNKIDCYDTQARKRISYLLFGFIPIFMSDSYIEGSFKNK